MPFHAKKGRVLIGPMALELEPKSIISLDFKVIAVPPLLLGDTIACKLTLSDATAQSGRYDCLTKLADRALAIPLLDRVVPSPDSINCRPV